MKFIPKKVGERRDAARYVIQVAVVNVLGGGEKSVVGHYAALRILAQLNNTDLEAAKKLLDVANIEYENDELINQDAEDAEMQPGKLSEEYRPDPLKGDTWVDEG